LNNYFSYFKETIYKISKNALHWKIVIIFIAIIPMLWWGLVPPDDTDSLYLLNFNLAWTTNQLTPYYNWFNYQPLHQLSFVPSMVITSSDNYFWFSMIKPVILLGLVTYAIGNELKLNKNLIWLSVFSSLVFFRIWMSWAPAFGSLKDDAIMGAGFLLISLSILNTRKQSLSRLSFFLLLLGFVFVSAKWQGLSVIVIGIILFVLLNWKEIQKRKRTFYVWIGIIFLVFMIFSGHIFIQSILEYGNPFYPMKITIFGKELSGTRDYSALSSTSIISNIDDERVWQILFPTDKISPGGLLFPLTLAFGTVGCSVLILYNLGKYFRKRNHDVIILYLAIFVLLSWVIYFNTVLTACSAKDLECTDIVHITDLHSMRYQFGTIFLTELFFVFVLVRIGLPNWAIFGIIGINLLSRLGIDYLRMQLIFNKLIELELIIYPILIAIVLVFAMKFLKKDIGRVIIISAIGISIFILVPHVVDDLRVNHAVHWKSVMESVHELPSSKIFLIDKYNKASLFPSTYAIYGDRFQHKVEMGSFPELEKILETQKNNFNDYPDYVVLLCHKAYEGCDEDKRKLSDELIKFNFIEKSNAKRGILFEGRN